MKVLVDFHHPDLYWSFVLTMERRLGWQVYRTIGMEWFNENYWEFEKFWAGDKFAQMFLPLYPDGTPADYLKYYDITAKPHVGHDILIENHWERPDPRHDYTFKMVTLEQARDQDWDIVMATVPHNQKGFAKFAKEKKAKIVFQVGNAEHPIDWAYKPLAIISTLLDPGVGNRKRFIHYDQEIDPSFSWTPLPEYGSISSFVLEWTNKSDLEKFLYTADHWPEHQFGMFGAFGNYLTTTDAVAEAMKGSRAIWHSKAIGDGWGHVIHGACAVGRPLIGVRNYYRGRIADRLWTPDNSLDISIMPKQQVAGMVKNLLVDEDRLQSMAVASRALFDKYIDYERDAENIRKLLE